MSLQIEASPKIKTSNCTLKRETSLLTLSIEESIPSWVAMFPAFQLDESSKW